LPDAKTRHLKVEMEEMEEDLRKSREGLG